MTIEQKQLDKWFNKYGGVAICTDKNIRAKAQAELETIFQSESKAYPMELIGPDEKLELHAHGTCKRCGWGVKKCNCIVRNKLRAELREKLSRKDTQ